MSGFVNQAQRMSSFLLVSIISPVTNLPMVPGKIASSLEIYLNDSADTMTEL
jgi:hypothetical protein